MYPECIVDPRSTAFSDPSFRGVLPHLSKPGGTYFVTFCLADVAPARAAERQRILRDEPAEKVADRTDLDPSSGACILKQPELAAIVEDALVFFQGERYALSAWVVMPNHVHAVVTPFDERTLSEILQSWKSFTAHEINRKLGRRGRLWQKESFDHLVRNAEGFERFVDYTERNPVAAGLVDRPADWQFSSARYREPL